MSVNSGLKATKIIGQRKAFYRQRVREFSRARKETVDIDILVTSIESSRFVSHRARMSESLIQEKIHNQQNLNEGLEYW